MRKLLSAAEFNERWAAFQKSPARIQRSMSFQLMYSSLVDGFSKNPAHFVLPLDDHGFHRGDGVFEAMKVLDGKIYLRDEHLDRLWRSSSKIHLEPPVSRSELETILKEACALSNQAPTQVLRLYVTRGSGGFGVSPAESIGSHLYVVMTSFQPADEVTWAKGVSLGLAQTALKPKPFCGIKSLNYLPNVLMKWEALQQKVDFTVGVESNGSLTEGATENVALINARGELCRPHWDAILDGCTLQRVFELARARTNLVLREGVNLTEKDLREAQEVFLVGTTLDVTPVTQILGETRRLGPWSKKLRNLLLEDQKQNSKL